MAIQAFSGGIQQFPIPDFVLSESIADGDILVYRDVDKAFHNETGNFTTLAQVNALIANINSGGTVDLSNYVTTTSLAAQIATINTTISTKADTTYVDTQIANINNNAPDLSNYVTNSTLSGTLANYDLSSEVTSKINTAIANASFFDGDYNNLTNTPVIPDLTGYATQSWVQNQIANTTLGTLSDVSSTAPTTGQVLKWNGTTWAPASDSTSGGGGSDADTLDGQDSTYYLDYTNLTNTPTIPADISDLTDTTNLLSGAAYTDASVDTHLNTSSATTNQVLSWDGSDYVWVTNSGGGGGATSLSGLTDVSSTSPTTGQVLKWNGSEWAPAVDSTSGIGGSSYATEAYVDQKITEIGDHFSGDYNDLTNTPVLFSGDYDDLLNKPAGNADLSLAIVGSNLQLLNIEPDPDTVISSVSLSSLGAAIGTSIDYADLTNKPNLFSGDYNDLVNRPNLFSGSYNDLSNKPYIPSIAGLASTTYVDNKVQEPNVSKYVKVSNVVLAQHDNFVMSIETTDATPTEALLTTGNRIVIDDDSTVMYNVHIIGADGTDNYGIKLQGIIDRTSGTLSLIGNPSKETLADTTNDTWSGSVSADTVNNSLKILVTGEASKTVNWTIFVEQNVVKR